MNLKTTYLGLELPHPLIVGASPFSHNVDTAKRLEDAGAAAIVMYSLFEEQLLAEQLATSAAVDGAADSFPEAASFLPDSPGFESGSEDYLKHLSNLKKSLRIPVIASLNGTSKGGWIRYAREMQQAGADAIELNTYNLSTEAKIAGTTVEEELVNLVREMRATVSIPISVKLSPFYSSLPNVASRLAHSGAGALVLFNRFLQPDIDVENLQVVRPQLSDSSDLLLRLHFLAILFGHTSADLAVTGGVHTPIDVIKSVMCGASGVQLVASLLKNGPGHIRMLLTGITHWLEEHEYESLSQARGSMSLLRCPNPKEYVRSNYMLLLDSWRSAEWAPR